MINNPGSLRNLIDKVSQRGLLFSQHAIDRINMPARLITVSEIKEVIKHGNIIEEYPDDPRGPSCLIAYDTSKQRRVCVVCAPKEEYLLIITAYPCGGEHK